MYLIVRKFTAGVLGGFLCISLNHCKESPAANVYMKKGTDKLNEIELFGTEVTTKALRKKEFSYVIEGVGKIKSFKEHIFYAPITGVVGLCTVQPGFFYNSGSELLKMETSLIELKLDRCKMNLFNSQKEYQSQLLAYENLLKGKSPEEIADIKKKLRISSGLSDAEQDIREASYELEQSCLKAPFSGVVANVSVQEKDHIKAGQELFTIYDIQNLYAEINILEDNVSSIKKGGAAQIFPIADPNSHYPGEIRDINPYVDENGMIRVTVKIKKAYGLKLFSGMNCRVVIQIPSEKILSIPKSAVVIRNGRQVVFTVENNKSKWNYVSTGRDNGKEVEIKSGLAIGDRVIVNNNLQLGNDSPVIETKGGD